MDDNPCSVCEKYIKGRSCKDRKQCPVAKMKRKYLEAKRELNELRNENAKLENDASWDDEIRHSHPGSGFLVMSDYIKREDAKAALRKQAKYVCREINEKHYVNETICYHTALYNVDKIPAADVRENVRGEWLDYDDTERFTAKCSICGGIAETRFGMNFCGYCGAYNERRRW